MPLHRRVLTALLCCALPLCAALPVAAQAPPPPFAPLGPVPVPAGNPTSQAKVDLGLALFWDEQLSRTGTVACGTCHMPRAGGTDPRGASDSEGSRHPGPDGVFGTADDVIGTAGVPRHGADGIYQASTLFGFAPQVTARQAPAMINAAYAPLLFWDGRASGVFVDPDTGQTLIAAGGALENQALGPLLDAGEMAHVGATLADMATRIGGARPLRLADGVPAATAARLAGRDYPALFESAFGSPGITPARIAMALATYQRSLVANQTPHDLQFAGQAAMTPDELAGRNAFVQAGCARCHGGPLLSNNGFFYIGVRPPNADPGRFAVTGDPADRGRMRAPPLRNIELSAPYMADGRFATLEQVVAFYNRGGDFNAPNKDPRIVPLGLSAGQQAQIITFLRRPLTDPRVRDESGPFARPRLFSESGAQPTPASAGTAGSAGLVPRLVAVEPALAGGREFTIGVEHGLAGAAALARIDPLEPIDAGAPSAIEQPLVLDAEGRASVDIELPSDAALLGRELFLRVFIADPQAAGGWASTNSARLRLVDLDAVLFNDGFEP
jgi:cytochrome c peroxidase